HVLLEEPREAGDLEAGADALVRGRRGDAFWAAQPGQRVGGVRRRTQLLANAAQGGGGEKRREIRRQLAAGGRLDISEHVDRAPPGEEAGNQSRRHREAGASEFFRCDRGRDRLAVDQNAVAIEDDHPKSPRATGSPSDCRLRINTTDLTQRKDATRITEPNHAANASGCQTAEPRTPPRGAEKRISESSVQENPRM